MRRFFSSIRFRLSLALAVTVFAVGASFIGAIYVWQVNRLEPPVVETHDLTYVDPTTSREVQTAYQIVFPEELQAAVAKGIEQHAYRDALGQLRIASFYALGLLAVTSFAIAWVVAGWTLGPVHHMAAVARDISVNDLSRRIALRGPDDELKGLADTFDDMVDRLQGSFEDQRRFIHDTSHELRNPLAVSRANLELALDGGDRAELARAAQVALDANERMSAMVDDLVEQARTGVPEVELEHLDLAALVASTVEENRAAAHGHGVTLAVSDGGPVDVRGEAGALRRVVANLIDNAVRVAPERSTVEIVTAADGDEASVMVCDHGPGVPEADRRRVFQRRWQGTQGTERGGSGLGLAIVERIVTRHGGRVWVESTPGGGATFVVRLPRLIESEHRAPASTAGAPSTGWAQVPLGPRLHEPGTMT